MNARTGRPGIPTASYRMLLDFLHASGSTLTPTEAMVRALKEWIAAQQRAAAPERGYQWKQLFLPHTTKLRARCGKDWAYACVEGDQLIYAGRSMSPREFALASVGDGRNAWRELWLRLPGERYWKSAATLRRALLDDERQAPPQPTSPTEAMAAAARSMSDTLQSALILLEHVDAHATRQVERRLPKHRRQEDYMIDACRRD